MGWVWYLALTLSFTAVVFCTDDIVIHTPHNVTIHELGHATVICSVTGTNASVIYKWMKEGESNPITNEPILDLVSVQREDAGNYICEVIVATDPFFRNSSTTLLLVQYLPRWVQYAPQKFAGHLGQAAKLVCNVHAFPEVSFDWKFQGLPMAHKNVVYSSDDHYSDVYPIADVSTTDYGTYSCNVTNAVGSIVYDVELVPPGIPDVPHWCELVNVTVVTAQLRCLPGYDGGHNLTFPVEKTGSHVPPGSADSSFQITPDGHILVLVEGLLPKTNYTLQVFAKNTHGQSEASYGVDVWTLDGVIPPPDKDPFPMSILIGAVVCGALLLVFVALLVVFLVRRKQIAREKERRRAECPEYAENKNNRRQEKETQKRQGSFRSSKRNRKNSSFRARGGPLGDSARFGFGPGSENQKKRSQGQLSGAAYNIAYSPSSSDDQLSERPGPRDSNIFHIAGFQPGESDLSYSNEGYYPEVSETSFGGRRQRPPLREPHLPPRYDDVIPVDSPLAPNVHSDAHVYTDAIRNAQRLSQEQPNLAGQGALSMVPIMNPLSNNSRFSKPPQVPPHNYYGTSQEKNQYHHSSQLGPNRQDFTKTQVPRKLDYAAVHPRDSSCHVPEEVWEFPKEHLYIRQKIGEGLVGEVWRARAQGILGREGEVLVAVKMLKDDYTEEEYRVLIRELRVMKMLQPHPNIVSLLGQCTLSDPLFIIMEYCTNGNLQQLLRCQRLPHEDVYQDRGSHYASLRYHQRLTSRDLVVFALHVARGMEYISSKEFLHRDLAARNVLVDENLICKISDFGLARDVAKSRQYESRTQGRLPIRWMAPESLFDCIYSTKSDVWSFGVLLWEVVTLGSSPYPGMAGPDVMELIQMGYRMDKPKLCSDHLYALMHDCWRHNPKQRPSFSTLVSKLEGILATGQEHDIYVEQMADNMYEIFESLPGEKC